MEIIYTPRFLRLVKKLPTQLRPLIEERINMFTTDPFEPSLKTHKLVGELKGCWAFSIDHKHRIIFEFDGTRKAVFHSAGNHSIYD